MNNNKQVLGAGWGHAARWLTVSHHTKMLYAFDTTIKNEYNQEQTEIVLTGENIFQGLYFFLSKIHHKICRTPSSIPFLKHIKRSFDTSFVLILNNKGTHNLVSHIGSHTQKV